MKNILQATALSTLLTLGSIAAAPADAATSSRSSVQVAAGACQPFFSTTQARYSAGGLTNAGTAQFYVACSMSGLLYGSANLGSSLIAIFVNNPTSSSLSVSCTARPGWALGSGGTQVAAPQSANIAAGEYKSFAWTAASFGTASIRNANFTCTLPPGAVIQFVEADGAWDVGA